MIRRYIERPSITDFSSVRFNDFKSARCPNINDNAPNMIDLPAPFHLLSPKTRVKFNIGSSISV